MTLDEIAADRASLEAREPNALVRASRLVQVILYHPGQGASMVEILVTGGGGVLGTALKDLLDVKGYDYLSLDTRSQLDLVDRRETLDFFNKVKPRKVVHLAGHVAGVGGNMRFPADIYATNTLVNTNIVEAACRSGTEKIVAMGTTAMYADHLPMPLKEIHILDGMPHVSERAYGVAKRSMLTHLEACKSQYGMAYALAVSTNLYGPNDRFDPVYGHVVPSLIRKFVEGSRSKTAIEIWGDGSPTRDFLYSADAAFGLLRLLDDGDGVYNLATGVSLPIADLVAILSTLKPDVAFSWDVTKPLGQLVRAYDISRLQALGFRPSVALADGIAMTVTWYERNCSDLRT